jgi:hypothetical protein
MQDPVEDRTYQPTSIRNEGTQSWDYFRNRQRLQPLKVNKRISKKPTPSSFYSFLLLTNPFLIPVSSPP